MVQLQLRDLGILGLLNMPVAILTPQGGRDAYNIIQLQLALFKSKYNLILENTEELCSKESNIRLLSPTE